MRLDYDVIILGGGAAGMSAALYSTPAVLKTVRVKDLETGELYDYPTSAAFIYIGFHSNSELFKGQIPMDEAGHIYTNINMSTDMPGVYAAGDIRVDSFRQLGSTVGDGITAALSAYRYISEG